MLPGVLALVVAVAPASARADDGVGPRSGAGTGSGSGERGGDAESAVQLATDAFEYRDFKKVVEVLTPWLHPPHIEDRALRISARQLLGVSLHVLGQRSEAKEEFGQLLLEDPTHKLDPFVVPPPVVQAFEEVRRQMKPTLDRVLKERGLQPEAPRPALVLVPVPNAFVGLLPFGLPQFQLDEPRAGAAFLGLEVAGLAANVAGYLRGRAVQESGASPTVWIAAQYAGLGVFVASWAVSAALGTAAIAERTRALLIEPPRGTAITPAAASAPTPPAPPADGPP